MSTVGILHVSASLNAARRARDLEALAAGEVVDVLVVGGGITGAGVALDAASRGLSVALVERRDLAHGTSRWSSKLVHGGLRYLAHGEVGLALESARERGILMEHTAPHLVHALPMVLPLGDDLAGAHALAAGAGGRIGDLLRAVVGTSRDTLPPPRRISATETLLLAPALDAAGLRGGLLLWDGQLEDDARLVVAVARTAASLGARIVSYCRAIEVSAEGAVVHDEVGGDTVAVRARHVVNATGAWADRLDPAVSLRPSKGAHLVVPADRLRAPLAAVMLPLAEHADRYVFALPQSDGRVLIGLTDEALDGPVPDLPAVEERDVRFLLSAVNRALGEPLEAADVVGAFAGVRPLLADAAGDSPDLSRRHRVFEAADGLLTVVGGKLTTYRRMAEDVVDRIAARPGVRAERCRTARLPLVGAAPRARLARLGLPPRLVRRYGGEAPFVAALAEDDPSLLRPVAPGLDTLGVELRFGVEHEGALGVDDLLDRRTRLGLVPADRDRAMSAARAAVDRLAVPAGVLAERG